jgi:hypothetical protein
MIRYIDDLYLTDKTSEKIKSIKRRLRLGAGIASLYVIMLSKNTNDVFDIVPAPMFKIRSFRHQDHLVIGLAESRRKAYDLVSRIVLDHYNATGQYTGLKDYCKEAFG